MLKNLFRRKHKEPYLGDLKLGASLDEALAWKEKVRQRNLAMEHPKIRIGDEAFAERSAELLYRKFKRGLGELDSDAQHQFWLKLLWYVFWRAPYVCKEAIEKEKAKVQLPDGRVIVHTARPSWIRRPRGGDEFDRGEVAERRGIPL